MWKLLVMGFQHYIKQLQGNLKNIFTIVGAVQRWLLAQPDKAAISHKCQEMVSVGSNTRTPKGLDRMQKEANEQSVQSNYPPSKA